jgi:hypothetical protein
MPEPDWARHCAGFAADHVKAATGKDIWNGFGHVPRSPREAADFFRWAGVTNLKDAVTVVMGEPVDPAFAMRGDIAMVDGALGIVRGDLIECLDRMQPIHRAICVWHLT